MTVLDEIIDGVRVDLAEREAARPARRRSRRPRAARPTRSTRCRPSAPPGVSVIAEVKRSSPSKGALADDRRPGRAGRRLRRPAAPRRSACSPSGAASAAASPTCARSAAAVDIPVLRKDFIVTSYQLWEARAAGADLVLLIVAALDQNALEALHRAGRSIGLTPLVEVHDEEEVDRALDAGATLIGVNARNLQDPRGRPGHLRPARPADPRRRRPGRRVRRPRPARRDRVRQAGRRRRPGRRDPGHRRRPPRRGRRPGRRRRAPGPEAARLAPQEPAPACPHAAPTRPTRAARRPLRPVRRPVHARGADGRRSTSSTAAWQEAMADPAFTGEFERLLREYAGVPEPAVRRRPGSPSSPAPGSCSSARTSTTPARTRSATCSARRCSPSGWARPG